MDALLTLADDLPRDRAGLRLNGHPALDPILGPTGAATRLVSDRLGRPAFAVRAVLFDKTKEQNWSLAWHQDRTIVVRDRREAPSFGPWTIKQGLLHVAPPWQVLAAMITVRIHLDPVPSGNAPLLIAAGTHQMGRIAERDIPKVVASSVVHTCLADAGDIWLYSTPILHASELARAPARRRVLQADYATNPLPGGLEWLGCDDDGSGGGT